MPLCGGGGGRGGGGGGFERVRGGGALSAGWAIKVSDIFLIWF